MHGPSTSYLFLILIILSELFTFLSNVFSEQKKYSGTGVEIITANVLTSYIYNNEHAIMMGQSQK